MPNSTAGFIRAPQGLRDSAFSNADELIVTEAGQLRRIEDELVVERDSGEKREILASISNVFDRLNYDTDTTDEISTTFSTEDTVSGGQTSKISSASESERTSGAGGEVSMEREGGVKTGVKFNASVSDKVAQKTGQELTLTYQVTSVQSRSSPHKIPLVLKARKITVVTWVWERVYVTGRTRLGSQNFPWEITTGLFANSRIAQYNGIADLPADVFEDYRRKYPEAGFGLLRAGSPILTDGDGTLGLFVISDLSSNGSFT